jgi:hypothetical protein
MLRSFDPIDLPRVLDPSATDGVFERVTDRLLMECLRRGPGISDLQRGADEQSELRWTPRTRGPSEVIGTLPRAHVRPVLADVGLAFLGGHPYGSAAVLRFRWEDRVWPVAIHMSNDGRFGFWLRICVAGSVPA